MRGVVPLPIARLIERGRRRSRRVLLRGDRFHCPFCAQGYSRFDPAGVSSAVFEHEKVVGGGVRADARCPGCRSLERERLMYLSLDRFMPAGPGPVDLLHFAPERNLSRVLRDDPRVRHVSADLFADDVDRKLDVCALDVPDASFDVVICNHVLEHVADDRLAMREILRVLRPGRAAVLQVPIAVSRETTLEDASVVSQADREARFGQRDHARLYGTDYRERLRDAGLELEEYLPPADVVSRYGLDAREWLFVVRRPSTKMDIARE